ncbi:MAG: DUF4386 domain-containing protein [Lewinellaceae bacterium]|nr:DUF4386 domain-containing protein [Lewinellaceae bacterium]
MTEEQRSMAVKEPKELVKNFVPGALARTAGLLYLLVILFGVFAELYVRSGLIVPGDAAETARNIRAHRELFRLGFVSDLLMQASFFFLALAFYRLFRAADKRHALLMLCSVMVSVAVMCLNMIHQYAALLILEGSCLMQAFDGSQADSLILLFMNLHKHGYRIAQIFFGIWLFPLGLLAYRSGFIPRLIGVLLMIACFSFLAGFFLFFLLPGYSAGLSSLVTLPTTIGEFALCLWLLIKGVKERPNLLTS